MQRSQIFILIFTLTFALEIFAYTPKEGNVTATLGPFIHKTHYNGSPSGATSPLLGGVGLLATGDISDVGALEIGMFGMNKIYFRDQGEQVVSEETEMMYITMGYRRWTSPSVSVAAAFYSSYTMGSPRILHNDFPAGQEPTTSANDTTDYGFDFSIQGEVFSQDRMSVIVDARYSLCVTPKVSEKADHYGVLVGFRYFIQEKQVRERPPGT